MMEPGQVAESLRDALVEFGRDGERALTLLAELYDRDVLFRDPLQTLRGRDAFLTMNRRVLGRARRLSFDVKDVLGGRALWPNAAAATAPGGSLPRARRRPPAGTRDHRDRLGRGPPRVLRPPNPPWNSSLVCEETTMCGAVVPGGPSPGSAGPR